MKIQHLACVLGLVAWLAACAERRTESAAPSTSPDNAVLSGPSPPPELAPALPAPAPAEGASRRKSADSGSNDEQFVTLEAAERALNRAQSDLDRLALADASARLGQAAPADGVGKAEKRSAMRPAAPSAAANTGPSTLCENACRVFASLSRAANAVCRLDGDNGTHCTRAKRMVADAEPRVASCACIPAD